jgi:hypothetical protein
LPMGYERRRSHWYMMWTDCIGVLYLQRSQWAPAFYMNIGILIRQLDRIKYPSFTACHLRGRANEAVRGAKAIDNLLDLNYDKVADAARIRRTNIILRDRITPFLNRLRDLRRIRRAWKAGDLVRMGSEPRLRMLLGEKE